VLQSSFYIHDQASFSIPSRSRFNSILQPASLVYSMFARITAVFFCALVFLGAILVDAAPLAARQIGDLQCNIDRLKIVGDIVSATSTAKTLTSQLASDTNGSALIATVTQGLNDASSGIGQIATALFTGQTAPAASRDQVEQGLTNAVNAANSITSTDAKVTSNVNKLKSELQAAVQAGDGVLSNCK